MCQLCERISTGLWLHKCRVRIRRFVNEVRSDRTDVGVTALAVEYPNSTNTGELTLLGSVDTGPNKEGVSAI